MATNEPKDYVKKKANPYEKNKEIPSFSYKGALVLFGFAIIGSFVFPVMFMWLMPSKYLVIIGNTFITSFGLAFTRYKIETKRGFVKGFYRLWILFGIAFFVISTLWMIFETAV